MMRISIVLFLLALLVSCTRDKSNNDLVELGAPSSVDSYPYKGMAALDLSDYGGFSEIMVPDRSRSGVDASVYLDDVTGFINIKVGKGFQLLIREEPTTLEDIKQELQNDQMWRNSIVSHDEHSIRIEKTLPDGSMAQYHFATVLPGIGTNVVMRSDPMGEFSEKDIEKMLYSANTLRSADGLAIVK